MSENEAVCEGISNPPEKNDNNKENSSKSLSERRNLRKRKLNLNRLASAVTCPVVCQFQFCGIRLKDGESLEWHYEGHLAQELEKLDKKGGLRVKKNPKDFPDRYSRLRVRQAAYERIKFRRETRGALPITERVQRSVDKAVRCPVCDETLGDDSDLKDHVEACLVVTDPGDGVEEVTEESDEELDVDGQQGFEEYEWAGQRRVRATALIEGGLRGAGFLTIKKGDENEVLDIENDTEEDKFGPRQYSDSDVILPSADSLEEEEERDLLREATLGKTEPKLLSDSVANDTEDINTDEDVSKLSKPDLCSKISKLKKQSEEIRQRTVCNVCMDCYAQPVVSITCYHVHCEQCWLRALGAKKLCPQCKVITRPQDLRRIYL